MRESMVSRAGEVVIAMFVPAVLSILLPSCGKDGKPGAINPAPTEEPIAEDPLQLTTRVGIDAMGYSLPLTTNCLKPALDSNLADVVDFTADGIFKEWTGTPVQLGDAKGDAPAGVDLTQSQVARFDEGLVFAIQLKPSATASVLLEMGGIVIRNGKLLSEQRLLIRWNANAPNGLEEWGGSAFTSVQDLNSAAALGPDGLEVKISRRLLGDAATWPAFWIRLSAGSSTPTRAANTIVGDSANSAFFPSLLGGDAVAFNFSGCTDWATQKLPFVMEHIIDSASSRAHRPGDKGNFSIDRAAEAAFQLTRFAHDATRILFQDEALPLSRLSVVATTSGTDSPQTFFQHSQGEKDLAALYGPLVVNINDLDLLSASYFPEGAVLRLASGRFIELRLQASFPAAPTYLRHAMRTALLDQLLIQNVGMSYWLDSYLATIQPFRGNEANAILTIGQMDEQLATPGAFPTPAALQQFKDQTDGKIAAFGHLLFSMLSAEQLLKAWALAPQFVASGDTPTVGWRKALSKVVGVKNAQAVAQLWQGWLEGNSYAPNFSPAWLDDGDSDGVPAFIERKYGTSDAKADSDGDGWNDIAELTVKTNPLSASERPKVVMPDGSFDDWLELMPKHITIDKGIFGACPKAANISHFAAIVNRDSLVIGAHATAFWESDKRAKWEAVVDLPSINRQFLITATSGDHQIFVKDGKTHETLQTFERAMPLATQTIEWILDRQTLSVPTYFNETDGVRLRLRTIFNDGEDHFCDETDWFNPTISQ